MAQRPRQLGPIVMRHAPWHVTAAPADYRFVDETGAVSEAASADALQHMLLQLMEDRALAALPDHGRLRGALAVHEGQGILFVGSPQSGKTTLALALLLAGFEVSGDDLVLIQDDHAIAMPRRFAYWETARDLLPMLPGPGDRALRLGDRRAELKLQIDPTDLGRVWTVRPVPIAAIFCLDPNFGGRSTLRRCTAREALPFLLAQYGPPPNGHPAAIGRFCAMADRSHIAILTLGALDDATRWIRRALEALPEPAAP
jgi:hypothetical protein